MFARPFKSCVCSVTMGLLLIGLAPNRAPGATIKAPMGDGVTVPRLTYHSDTNQWEWVTYTIEIRNGTVKYEDAPVGLGEEGYDQVDTFHFSVANPASAITVVTKAGQSETLSSLEATEGSSITDANGFQITVADRAGDRFIMKVRSVDAQKALSHVTFGFDSSLGDAGEFSNLPVSSGTSKSYSNIVYGIDKDTGELVRHDFSENTTQTIGTVTDDAGDPLTGIDAGVYMPGLQNTFTFWQDPDDGKTKLIYVNLETAESGQVGQSLGEGKVSGATHVVVETSDGTRTRVFAIQEDVDAKDTAAQLVEVDPKTGETTPLMDLDRQYDSLAYTDDGAFYATDDNSVYQLNPNQNSEANVGIFDNHDLDAMEVVDGILSSFENSNNSLVPMERSARVSLGDQDVGMSNAGTIVQSEPTTDPHGEPASYD